MPVRVVFRSFTTDKSRNKLREIRRLNSFAEASLEGVMIVNAQRLIAIAGEYPPERPESTYTRTFRLERAWVAARFQAGVVRKSAGAWAVTFSVNPQDERGKRYAPWVHGGFYGGAKVEQQTLHAETGWVNVPELRKQLAASGVYRRQLQGVINRYYGVR